MIVNMKRSASAEEIEHVIDRIKECGFQAHVVRGEERTIIGAVGSSGRRSEIEALRAAPGVAASAACLAGAGRRSYHAGSGPAHRAPPVGRSCARAKASPR